MAYTELNLPIKAPAIAPASGDPNAPGGPSSPDPPPTAFATAAAAAAAAPPP